MTEAERIAWYRAKVESYRQLHDSTRRRLAQMTRELGAATAGVLDAPLWVGGPTPSQVQREVNEINQQRLDDPERRRCTICLQPIVNGWCRCPL